MPQADLVLEGGGLKGLATAGSCAALTEAGYTFPRVAGTSAGAAVAAFLAAGASPTRLARVMSTLDYRNGVDRALPRVPVVGTLLPRLPVLGGAWSLAGELWSLLRRGDAYDDHVHTWIREELETLGVRTFADLRRHDTDDDRNLTVQQRYSLVVTVADLTHGRLLRLPWDYPALGLDPDAQPVADAVRAAMSLPLHLAPARLHDERTGTELVLVDGGVLSGLPLDLFDRTDTAPRRWPTFGVEATPQLPEEPGSFPWLGRLAPHPVELATTALSASFGGHGRRVVADPAAQQRTIAVDTSSVPVLAVHASPAQRHRLRLNGYQAGTDFLSRWDWDAYQRAHPATTR